MNVISLTKKNWFQLIVVTAPTPSRNLPPSTPLEKIDGWRRIKLLPRLSMKINITSQHQTYPQNVQCHKLGKMLSCRTEPKCWRCFSCTVKNSTPFRIDPVKINFVYQTHSSKLKFKTVSHRNASVFNFQLQLDNWYVFSFCLFPAQSNCKNDK